MAITEFTMPAPVHTKPVILLWVYTDGVATDRDDNLWTRQADQTWRCTESRSGAEGQVRGYDQVREKEVHSPSPFRWQN